MLKIARVPFFVLVGVLTVSCASERKVTYERAKGQGLSKYESDVEFQTDENGQTTWKNAKRSSFESQSGYGAKKDFNSKAYSKKNFEGKSWSANKRYAAKQYRGYKDASKFQQTPHFAQQQSRAQGQYLSEREKGFGTESYASADKQAHRGRNFEKIEDAETNFRRRVYEEPRIQSQEEYNGLSLSDTRGMLGR